MAESDTRAPGSSTTAVATNRGPLVDPHCQCSAFRRPCTVSDSSKSRTVPFATGVGGAQGYLSTYTFGAVTSGLNSGSAEDGMANGNRILAMQNTGTGLSRTARFNPKLTSLGATRVLGGVGFAAAYGYNYMQARQEGQSRTRSAVTSTAQAGADSYISLTMAESGLEAGAIVGSFVGPEGTVIGGAVGGVLGLGAGFVTSNIANNVISDVGSWFHL